MATGIKDFGIIWLGWFSSWRTTSAWKASAHGLCSFYLEGRQELCQGWAGLGTTPILGWLNSGVCSEMVYSELFRRINLLRATNTLDKPAFLTQCPGGIPVKHGLHFPNFTSHAHPEPSPGARARVGARARLWHRRLETGIGPPRGRWQSVRGGAWSWLGQIALSKDRVMPRVVPLCPQDYGNFVGKSLDEFLNGDVLASFDPILSYFQILVHPNVA